MFHFFVDKVLFWVTAVLLVLQAHVSIFHGNVPNIRTAPAIRKKIIELLKKDFEARNKTPYTIFDLGSGNGLLTREIARALPHAQIIGIELAKQSVVWSNLMKRLTRLDNVSYLKMSFLDYDFSNADAIVMYMIPPVLSLLSKKLQTELRDGTLVTSNKFPLRGGWEPVETLRIKTLYFHQGDLHIYRKSASKSET